LPRSPHLCLAFSLLAAALLSGCESVQQQPVSTVTTVTPTPVTPTPATTPGSPIAGNVHGGQQPVTGAHIYLLAANPAGYGAPSVSILNTAMPGVLTDAVGTYVLTDGQGNFHISGDYTCTEGQLVYLLALGGNPGLPNGEENPALALMSAFGECPEGYTNFATTVPFVFINEVTTVSAAYGLAGFMPDVTHLGYAPTAGAHRGLANAFLAVNNLFDTATGVARVQNLQGNGTVPQAEINSLANLLVNCVNSDGTTGCTQLFANAPSLSGTPPTDTVTAALNIARNPAANVPALYAASILTAPFQPALTAAPNDWSMAITYNVDGMVGPYFPAIDSAGNIWVPNYVSNSLIELDAAGNILSGTTGFTGGGLNQPYSVAIDGKDNAWVVNFGPVNASTISKFSPSGVSLLSSPIACDTACFFPAFDSAQNLWISGSLRATVLRADGSVLKKYATNSFDSGIAINSAGIGWSIGQPHLLYQIGLGATLSSTSELTTAASGSDLTSVAIDSADNVWYASSQNNMLGVSDKIGALVSPANGYSGGGLKGPAQIAIDGNNRVFVANRDGSSVSVFTNTGAAVSPTTGFQAPGLSNPRGLAIDSSGNVWVTNFTGNSITEFIGIATPTATPITPTNHGQRP
jgi:streptogramin lyase